MKRLIGSFREGLQSTGAGYRYVRNRTEEKKRSNTILNLTLLTPYLLWEAREAGPFGTNDGRRLMKIDHADLDHHHHHHEPPTITMPNQPPPQPRTSLSMRRHEMMPCRRRRRLCFQRVAVVRPWLWVCAIATMLLLQQQQGRRFLGGGCGGVGAAVDGDRPTTTNFHRRRILSPSSSDRRGGRRALGQYERRMAGRIAAAPPSSWWQQQQQLQRTNWGLLTSNHNNNNNSTAAAIRSPPQHTQPAPELPRTASSRTAVSPVPADPLQRPTLSTTAASVPPPPLSSGLEVVAADGAAERAAPGEPPGPSPTLPPGAVVGAAAATSRPIRPPAHPPKHRWTTAALFLADVWSKGKLPPVGSHGKNASGRLPNTTNNNNARTENRSRSHAKKNHDNNINNNNDDTASNKTTGARSSILPRSRRKTAWFSPSPRTARLLLPTTTIVVACHKLYSTLYTAGQDWYTGYYIRTTLQRMEQQYHRQYQVPAAMRSVGRLATHWLILSGLGVVMDWMVGLSHPPCRSDGIVGIGIGAISSAVGTGGGCHWWCGLLWLISVTGPGHLLGVAVAIWVRGLRIQIPDCDDANNNSHRHSGASSTSIYNHRPSGRRIITRPLALLRWMMDPGRWFREIIAHDRSPDSALKPFDPDWLMFPATWRTLRVLQMLAVAKEMHGSDFITRALMRHVLLQQAFGDEWYRVLMIEKRVGWSIVLMAGYIVSTMGLFWNMVRKPAYSVSSLSILFTAPSILAVAISGWMNVLVYFDRRQHTRASLPSVSKKRDGGQDPVQEAIEQYQRVTVPLPLDRI